MVPSRPMSADVPIRPIAANRKARHLYELLDELEVGIQLEGTEVKSLRGGQCSLQEAYVRIRGTELWLVGAHIPEYAFGNRSNHEPTRERKLLAQRRQIDRRRGCQGSLCAHVQQRQHFLGNEPLHRSRGVRHEW